MSREVYRQFKRGKGFSDYTDEASNHPDSTATCWWCMRPVLSSEHDFMACLDGMFVTVTHYRRQPKVIRETPDHPSLFASDTP